MDSESVKKAFINKPEELFIDALQGRQASQPFIYAGNLSDEQLINFLEGLVVEIASRRDRLGEPDRLRERAEEIEKILEKKNESIDSVVFRQSHCPTRHLL